MDLEHMSASLHLADTALGVRRYMLEPGNGFHGLGPGSLPLGPRIFEHPLLRSAVEVSVYIPNLSDIAVRHASAYHSTLRHYCVDFIFNAAACQKFVLLVNDAERTLVDVNGIIEWFETSADVAKMTPCVEYRMNGYLYSPNRTVKHTFAKPTACLIPQQRGVVVDESKPSVLFDVCHIYNVNMQQCLTVAVASEALILRRGRIQY